jgi:hypothetical protein
MAQRKVHVHVSSGSTHNSLKDVKYCNEKTIGTFAPKGNPSSSAVISPVATWEVAHVVRGDKRTSARFTLNLKKISEEEGNYRINMQLRGEREVETSSGTD